MENWLTIKDYPNYQISDQGNVRRIDTGLLRKFQLTRRGYHRITLGKRKKDGTGATAYGVHRLVAMYFIKNTENKPQVNHRNGIKTDNRVENLEWATNSENAKHSFRIGLQSNVGSKNPAAKMTESDALFIKLSNLSSVSLSKAMGIPLTSIYNLRCGKTWKHVKV